MTQILSDYDVRDYLERFIEALINTDVQSWDVVEFDDYIKENKSFMTQFTTVDSTELDIKLFVKSKYILDNYYVYIFVVSYTASEDQDLTQVGKIITRVNPDTLRLDVRFIPDFSDQINYSLGSTDFVTDSPSDTHEYIEESDLYLFVVSKYHRGQLIDVYDFYQSTHGTAVIDDIRHNNKTFHYKLTYQGFSKWVPQIYILNNQLSLADWESLSSDLLLDQVVNEPSDDDDDEDA